jgi:hypothetical protein
MSAQRVWALLLLASVFSMHGVQCVAAGVDSVHGMSGGAHASAELSAWEQVPDSAHAAEGHLSSGAVAGPVVLAVAAGMSQEGLPLPGGAFGAVCLAVLLTGVIALAAAALIGRAPASRIRARAPSSLRHTGWSRIPRPPDLSTLCLLRI